MITWATPMLARSGTNKDGLAKYGWKGPTRIFNTDGAYYKKHAPIGVSYIYKASTTPIT